MPGKGSVGVLDLGLGNLASVARALEAVGCDARLSRDPDGLRGTDGLVVPGVGAFAAAARALLETGAGDLMLALVCEGRPVLGICLGWQLLCAGARKVVKRRGWGWSRRRYDDFPQGCPSPMCGGTRCSGMSP